MTRASQRACAASATWMCGSAGKALEAAETEEAAGEATATAADGAAGEATSCEIGAAGDSAA